MLPVFAQEVKQQDFFIGFVKASTRMDWVLLDAAISQAFRVSLGAEGRRVPPKPGTAVTAADSPLPSLGVR